MTWALPETTEIGGAVYRLHADYRDILEIIGHLQGDEDGETRSLIALRLFYEEFSRMPPRDWPEAARYLEEFLSCGEAEDSRPRPKLVDWEQDGAVIVAEINKAAHCEIRELPHLHWFTFVGWYMGIGEGQLSTIVAIRRKLQKKKKLEKWEREFYRENKIRIDFQRKYTAEEQAERARLNALLGG